MGRVRDHNEDSFLVDKALQLYIVCDGMGGHAAGEVASTRAAHTVRDALAQDRDALAQFEAGETTMRKDILRLLEASVQQACTVVHQEGVDDESKRGMGTTLDALLVVGNRGFIAHVGDARIYLYRQGSVHQLTEDHSLINELLKRGRLTREQIAKVKYKNAVTRAVGVYESVEVDVFDFDVLPGDRFLLCSDGLHEYLEESELPGLFEDIEEDALTPHLIQLANDRGGKDNITALVVRVPEAEDGVDVLAREVQLKLDVLHEMPLFRFLTYQELVRVLNITQVRNYEPGQAAVIEGDDGDELFIVLSGKMKVHSGGALISEFTSGDHFGEMALIDKAPRSASVTAMEESRALAITRRGFFDMIRKDHDVAVKLLWSFLGVLTKRLRSTSRELGDARNQLATDVITKQLLGSVMPMPIGGPDTLRSPAPDASLLETVDLRNRSKPKPVSQSIDGAKTLELEKKAPKPPKEKPEPKLDPKATLRLGALLKGIGDVPVTGDTLRDIDPEPDDG